MFGEYRERIRKAHKVVRFSPREAIAALQGDPLPPDSPGQDFPVHCPTDEEQVKDLICRIQHALHKRGCCAAPRCTPAPYDVESDSSMSKAPPPRSGPACRHHKHKRKHGSILDVILATPIGNALLNVLEPWLLLEPNYVFSGSEAGEELKEPREYGLPEFQAMNIIGSKSRQKLLAWYHPATRGFPTIAYCHGNCSSLDARSHVLKELAECGFGVMIVAYPGFKGSRTDENGNRLKMDERSFINAAKLMVKHLNMHEHVPYEDILMFGESMGSAVAIKAAYELEQGNKYHYTPPQDLRAVVCFAAFSSLPDRVREEHRYLAADQALNLQLDSNSYIAKLKAPVVLAHGTADEVTCCHHSVKLAKTCHDAGKEVDLLLLPGANHRLSKPMPAEPAVPALAM